MTQYEMLKALLNGDTLVGVVKPKRGSPTKIRLINSNLHWIEHDNTVGPIAYTVDINGSFWEKESMQ
jgi:hypothetical protein